MLLTPDKKTVKSDTDIRSWVDNAFQKLSKATSIVEVELIPDTLKILPQNKLSTESYPEIKYSLTLEEIQDLKRSGLLEENNTFSTDLSAADLDPVAKLLYAIAWKNGDLQKVKHIVAGVLNCKDADTHDREEGIVFYQFGRYLTKTPGEPIIDQHVLRAFGISQTDDLSEIKRLRKLSVFTKKENKLIKAYKDWLQAGKGLQESLRQEEGYTYHLDKLLFAIGKTIKLNKP
ncbi:hypothetical protein [Adhaeribacter rhizoryzae]|uniref:Uncharacterized protein n=1 Tax=Adhaeribacter rhizoryzae TaxID=2607907 RepID=A0A5M6D6G3_9BACT|nr:hypothetical protein [Adhaeribacter rhizoryzae]KAA5542326.1 hypothetical protein F0145_19035 [Adhaeribacter rhizoryzae]